MIYTKSDASFEETKFDLSIRGRCCNSCLSCTLIVAGSDNPPTRSPYLPLQDACMERSDNSTKPACASLAQWRRRLPCLLNFRPREGAVSRDMPHSVPLCGVTRSEMVGVVERGLGDGCLFDLIRRETATPLQGGSRWCVGGSAFWPVSETLDYTKLASVDLVLPHTCPEDSQSCFSPVLVDAWGDQI